MRARSRAQAHAVEPSDGCIAVTQELFLGVLSGLLVSFMLGVVGGGGSILAIPLLVHVVGVRSPHVAIGISAVAVAANALANLPSHIRRNRVKWGCVGAFAVSGIAGALAGSQLGKAIDGKLLLAVFGGLMIVVGVTMFSRNQSLGDPHVRLTLDSARALLPRLATTGFVTGAASGFFGIGGGFLITPSLMWATGMPIDIAIGSSLVAVSAFAMTTAASYASVGLVDWPLAAAFVAGGLGGALLSAPAASALARHKRLLTRIFAVLVVAVGTYIAIRGILNLV